MHSPSCRPFNGAWQGSAKPCNLDNTQSFKATCTPLHEQLSTFTSKLVLNEVPVDIRLAYMHPIASPACLNQFACAATQEQPCMWLALPSYMTVYADSAHCVLTDQIQPCCMQAMRLPPFCSLWLAEPCWFPATVAAAVQEQPDRASVFESLRQFGPCQPYCNLRLLLSEVRVMFITCVQGQSMACT